jgi:ATP-dependent Lon protease
VTRTYLEWMATLPWSITTAEPVNVQRAAQILD